MASWSRGAGPERKPDGDLAWAMAAGGPAAAVPAVFVPGNLGGVAPRATGSHAVPPTDP